MLYGTKVRLRGLEESDAELAHRWINDREVTQYLMARYPFSMAFEKEWATNGAKNNNFTDVRFIIETLDGVPIGMTGLHHGAPEDRHSDLGIMIGEKEYWSQGYGTDAMLTVLRFAFYQMNLNRVGLGVFANNPRAQAVYRKIGFVDEGRTREAYFQDGEYIDVIRMGILRREFEALYPPESARNTVNSTAGA